MNKGYKYKPGQIPHGIDPLKGISLSPTAVPQYTGQAQNVPPEMREAKRDREIFKSDLPDHIYPFYPRSAQTLNLKNPSVNIAANSNGIILEFTTPASGGVTRIWKYGLTTDATSAEFRFLINDHNALPFHGNPQNENRIDAATGPDLNDINIIDVQLLLQPGQNFKILGVNGDGAQKIFGARIVGYFDTDQVRRDDRLGG